MQLNTGADINKKESQSVTIADGAIINVNFEVVGNALTASYPANGGVTNAKADYSSWYLNVQGAYNNWEPEGIKFDSDGYAKKTNQNIGDGEFEIKIWNGGDQFYGTGGVVKIGEWITLSQPDNKHMTIEKATSNCVFDVEYKAATNEMKLTLVSGNLKDDTEEPDPDPETSSLYVVGDGKIGNTGLGWDPANPYEVAGEEGVYTFTVTDFEKMKISTEKSETNNWDKFNNNAFCIDQRDNSDLSIDDLGKELKLYHGVGQDIIVPVKGEYDVVVTISDENSTIKVTPKFEIEEPVNTYFVHGKFSGNEDWTDYELVTDTEGKIYATGKVEVKGNDAQMGVKKMNGESQVAWFSAANGTERITGETKLTLKTDDIANMSIAEGTYVFSFKPENNEFTVTPVVDIPTIYIRGTMNDWHGTEMNYVRRNDNGELVYEIGFAEIADGAEFKFAKNAEGDDWGYINLGASSDDYTIYNRDNAKGLHNAGDSKNVHIAGPLKNAHIFLFYHPEADEQTTSSLVMIDTTPDKLDISGEVTEGWGTMVELQPTESVVTDKYEYDYMCSLDKMQGQFKVWFEAKNGGFGYGNTTGRYDLFNKQIAARNSGGNFDPVLTEGETGTTFDYGKVNVIFHYNPIGECYVLVIPREMYVVNYKAADQPSTMLYNPEGQTGTRNETVLSLQTELPGDGTYEYAGEVKNINGDFRVESHGKNVSFGAADENDRTFGEYFNPQESVTATKGAAANTGSHFTTDGMDLKGGAIKLTYTPETGEATLAVDGTATGVSDIAVDGNEAASAVRYYNLQGVRVDNPQHGVYIRVEGRTATKVMVD